MSKILSISAKCSDMFGATLFEEGKVIGEYDGYVPKFFPADHFGDYVFLNIDIETGMIVNWNKPSDEDLAELFNNED